MKKLFFALLLAGGTAFAQQPVIISGTPTIQVTSWAGGTLGAMANYGTSPGAVLVPGANVFVTNTNPNGPTTDSAASPVALSTNQTGAAGSASSRVLTVGHRQHDTAHCHQHAAELVSNLL